MPSQDTPKEPNPSGLCMCGCGERTNLAHQTCTKSGTVRDKPLKYIYGHHHRVRTSPVEYVVQDCGYVTPCWVWQRGRNAKGYGRVNRKKWGKELAYQVYYERSRGPIPEALILDHLCRNPACVNPDHLEPVTYAENARRGDQAKITMEQAEQIRSLRGKYTQREIGEMFGIGESGVGHILRGRCWVAHPTDP